MKSYLTTRFFSSTMRPENHNRLQSLPPQHKEHLQILFRITLITTIGDMKIIQPNHDIYDKINYNHHLLATFIANFVIVSVTSQSLLFLVAQSSVSPSLFCQSLESINDPWIIGFRTTHHITFNFDDQSLATKHEYHGLKEIAMGNYNIISITHIGNANLRCRTIISNYLTLCVFLHKNNLIFI